MPWQDMIFQQIPVLVSLFQSIPFHKHYALYTLDVSLTLHALSESFDTHYRKFIAWFAVLTYIHDMHAYMSHTCKHTNILTDISCRRTHGHIETQVNTLYAILFVSFAISFHSPCLCCIVFHYFIHSQMHAFMYCFPEVLILSCNYVIVYVCMFPCMFSFISLDIYIQTQCRHSQTRRFIDMQTDTHTHTDTLVSIHP